MGRYGEWKVVEERRCLKSGMSKEIEIGEKKGFPGGVNDKEAACSAGDFRYMGSIPGSGRSPEEGQPVQYFCLENSMD